MWILAIRDIALFAAGVALLVKELVSRHPDPFILEIGAALMGTPSALHHRVLRRSIDNTSEPIPQQQQSDSPSTER